MKENRVNVAARDPLTGHEVIIPCIRHEADEPFHCPRCGGYVGQEKLACDACIDHSEARPKVRRVKPKPDIDGLFDDVPAIPVGPEGRKNERVIPIRRAS